MNNSLKVMFFCVLTLLVNTTFSQSTPTLDEKVNELSTIKAHKKWKITKHENTVKYSLTNTKGMVPLRTSRYDTVTVDMSSVGTYVIEVTVEANWTEDKYNYLRDKNSTLLAPLKKKAAKELKVDQDSYVDEAPFRYISQVRNWTEEEKKGIRKITKLPHVIVDGKGYFIHQNAVEILNFKYEALKKDLFWELSNTIGDNLHLEYTPRFYCLNNYENTLGWSFNGYFPDRSVKEFHLYKWGYVEPKDDNSLFKTKNGQVSIKKQYKKSLKNDLNWYAISFNINNEKRKESALKITVFSSDSKEIQEKQAQLIISMLKKAGINKVKKFEVKLIDRVERGAPHVMLIDPNYWSERLKY